ncbi:Glycolipid exporter Gap/Sap [Propionibacterium ruminifibrarum]|uniref:Glycolipid exporter Gap/Sap n=1 Tax=Propionibacterium ruminifibrarum TaxID=1962131 RepID=A0A375HZ26_9ACTN|nr:GAP family protein [Propionibacterium ruminifibrarum]SPF67751.1 Glycolipid exporter Gap/Sap [Propionibacterium ruminifibrarum]
MGAVWAAAGSMIGLGLLMGFSPTTYALVVHLLTVARRPGRSVAWICVGLAAIATVMLVLFHFVDPDRLTDLFRARASALLIRRGVDLVAGVLALAAGAAQLVDWRVNLPRRRRPRASHGGSPSHLIGLGVVAGIGLSEPATMYVTGRVIASVTHDVVVAGLLYLVFLAALVGPYLGAVLAWVRMPRVADAVRTFFERAARLDHRPIAGAVLLGIGVVFVLLAIVH